MSSLSPIISTSSSSQCGPASELSSSHDELQTPPLSSQSSLHHYMSSALSADSHSPSSGSAKVKVSREQKMVVTVFISDTCMRMAFNERFATRREHCRPYCDSRRSCLCCSWVGLRSVNHSVNHRAVPIWQVSCPRENLFRNSTRIDLSIRLLSGPTIWLWIATVQPQCASALSLFDVN